MSVQNMPPSPAVTVPWVRAQKGARKITVLTAYDYPTARILDQNGIDVILVGDSLGNVVYGESNTLSVTLSDIIRHTQAVAKAATRALVVADMPFLSYQVSIPQAVESAGQLLKQGHAQAVKLEGGLECSATIRALSIAGIPVMAHIGLTPQSVHQMGGYRTHGKTEAEKTYLMESALAVTQAGAFSVVLECIEASLVADITSAISVPTIGIGSGSQCDGQVLVLHDLIGLTLGHVPKFVAPLADVKTTIAQAVRDYIERTHLPSAQMRDQSQSAHAPTLECEPHAPRA